MPQGQDDQLIFPLTRAALFDLMRHAQAERGVLDVEITYRVVGHRRPPRPAYCYCCSRSIFGAASIAHLTISETSQLSEQLRSAAMRRNCARKALLMKPTTIDDSATIE